MCAQSYTRAKRAHLLRNSGDGVRVGFYENNHEYAGLCCIITGFRMELSNLSFTEK